MSEKAGYRSVLADILEYTDGRRLLTKKDVADYLGVDQRTAAKRFNLTKDGIVAPELARMLAK